MSDQNKEPVDPKAAALIARVKRLMLLTVGLTFIALAAVLTIIGYRMMNLGQP